LYAYDIRSGKIQKEKNRQFRCAASDGYFISLSRLSYKISNDDEAYKLNLEEVFLEKYTETGFEEVASFGMTSKYVANSETKNKLYFQSFDKEKDGVIIKSFDKKTQEVKELGRFTAKDFVSVDTKGYLDDWTIDKFAIVNIDKVTDDYCIFRFGMKVNPEPQYKYTFASKKAEMIGVISR